MAFDGWSHSVADKHEWNHDYMAGHEFDEPEPCTYTVPCADLKLGDYVVLKYGRPCKIVGISPCETGHKVQFIGIDLFTGRKWQELRLSSSAMEVPYVHYNECHVLDRTNDDFLLLQKADGKTTENVRYPEGELDQKIMDFLTGDSKGDGVVTVLSSMGEEESVSFKEVTHMQCRC